VVSERSPQTGFWAQVRKWGTRAAWVLAIWSFVTLSGSGISFVLARSIAAFVVTPVNRHIAAQVDAQTYEIREVVLGVFGAQMTVDSLLFEEMNSIRRTEQRRAAAQVETQAQFDRLRNRVYVRQDSILRLLLRKKR
jgi:hypothetical protein